MVRKSPIFSATLFPINTIRKGVDDKLYIITETKNKTKRWVVYKDLDKVVEKRKKKLILNSKDINNSNIFKKKYNKNSIELNIQKNNNIYIRHFLKGKDYIGSWYDMNLLNSTYKLDKNKLVYIIPEWEEENDDGEIIIKKKVKIEINFTNSGWKKFILFITYNIF